MTGKVYPYQMEENMKINTEVFQKHDKLINMLTNRENGVYGGLYFDFRDSYIYMNGKNGVKGRFPFAYEGEEEAENFYLNADKFLAITEFYNELDYDVPSRIFSNGSDRFNIEKIEDTEDYSDLYEEHQYEAFMTVEEESYTKLKKALQYTLNEAEINPVFRTIFLLDETLFSLKYNELFQTSFKQEGELKLSSDAVNFIKALGMDCEMYTTENSLKLVQDDIEILIPNNQSVEVPPIKEDSFKAGYEHRTFFNFQKDAMLDILDFMSIYYKDNESKNPVIKLKKISEDILEISSTTSKDSVIRTLDGLTTNLEDFEFEVDAEKLKRAIKQINDLTIKVKWSSEYFAMQVLGNTNIEDSVVFSYMQ
jgi:hypothetical protein